MLNFSIVIPVYNEGVNIINLINEIESTLVNKFKYEIIIVNDSSNDNTYELLLNFLPKKNIILLNHQVNQGQSKAIHTGIKNSSTNIICTIDGDGQNDPKDIHELFNIYKSDKNIKLVGGLRLKRQDSLIKIMSSKIANTVRSRILHDNCKDTGCSLKIFDKNIFLSFPFFDGIHRYLPALFSGFGYSTKFVNVNHRKRQFGLSKYGTMKRLFKGIKDLIKVKKIIRDAK